MPYRDAPAFPITSAPIADDAFGLTKREFAAITILAGVEASNFENAEQGAIAPEKTARYAVRLADALLAQLEKVEV